MNEWVFLLLSVLALGIVDGIEILIIHFMLKRQTEGIKKQIVKVAKKEALKEINKIIDKMKKYIRKQTGEIPAAILEKIDFDSVIEELKKKILKAVNLKLNRVSGKELQQLEQSILSLPAEQQQGFIEYLSQYLPEDVKGLPLRDILTQYAPLIKQKIAEYAKTPQSINTKKTIIG